MESLKELSELAYFCPQADWAKTLRDTHSSLQKAISLFWREPTQDNMRELNAQWAIAARLFKQCPKDDKLLEEFGVTP